MTLIVAYAVIIGLLIQANSMDQYQRRKYFASFGQRDILSTQNQYGTMNFYEKNASSPNKRNIDNQTAQKEQANKQINDQLNKNSYEEFGTSNSGSDDKKFKGMIIDAISSADRAVKAILSYGHTEIQKYCSDYFLKKEKLLSFLDSNNVSFFSNSDKNSKKNQKRKTKKKDNLESDLTQMVPINHLERLEKIVYNKIIPILQNQLQHQKKKSQKVIKKGKEWANSDLREGLMLLDRLNEKERIAVDECAELLEKFIVRIMDKEQKMMGKLGRIQDKLDQEMKKTQILSQELKKCEQYKAKSQKQWNKERKSMLRYEEFSKDVKLLFSEKEKLALDANQKQSLEDILNQIKRMLNNEERHSKYDKKCDHKHQKEGYTSSKEEASKNEQQIKSLKQVVKSLDKEICILRQQCETMDNKLQHSHEKVSKYESKSKKMIEQNEQMNKKIEQMIKEQKYKSKLIDQYLRMIAKLEETLRLSQENLIKLNEENDNYLQLIARHSSQKDECMKHLMETEQKCKQMDELISRKEIEVEQLVNSLCAKEKEINDYEKIVEKLSKEIQQLYGALKAKEENLITVMKQIQDLQQQLKTVQQSKALMVQVSKKDHQTSFQINNPDQNQKINRQTLQSIEHHSEEQIVAHSKNTAVMNPTKQLEVNKSIQEQGEKRQEYTLKKEERDDFIPANINKQRLEEILAEAKKSQLASINQDDKINIESNQKESNRDNRTYNEANKQAEEEIEVYVSHTLEDEIEPTHPPIDNQNSQANSHGSKPNFQNEGDYIKVEEVQIANNNQIEQKESNSGKLPQQFYAIQAQSQKIQQLIDLNCRISDQFNKLKQRMEKDDTYKKDIDELKQQMDCLTIMLSRRKRSQVKKIQKISKTELLHREAQEQIERLRHRLDDALIANRPFSQIEENSDGSGFTIPDHIQSFFKSNQDPYRFNQEGLSRVPIKSKQGKNFYTQTDGEVQTVHPPIIAVESEVVIQTSSPIVSVVDEKQEQVDKSFINDLDIADISPVLPNPTPATELIENSEEYREAILPNSLKDTPVVDKNNNPETPTAKQKIDQINQINLSAQRVQTPQKHPLQNSSYVRHIMNAPEKQKNQTQNASRSQVVQFCREIEIEEMKEMFTQREHEFSELVVEKDQQIERLKSIIKTLTKAQEVEQKASVKASRNKESVNREIQVLKNQNAQLWMFLQKEKSEIEKLRILIAQYELQETLHKIKSKSPKNVLEKIVEKEIENNQAFVIDITPVKKTENEINYLEVNQLSKSQNLPQERQSHELLLNTQKKENQNESSPSKQTQSPTKRFARKSERFIKDETPAQRTERRHTTPKQTLQFGWQELVPQYFGEKGKHSPKK